MVQTGVSDDVVPSAEGAAAGTTAPVLVGEDLHHRYGAGAAAIEALSGVDVTLRPRELVAVVGPSGSGKSTLLHVLSGLERPTRGRVVLEGRELTELDED